MSTTLEEIIDFQEFALDQVRNGGGDLSLEQLMELWRASHPTGAELQESVAAVEQAIRDMEAGDTGRPVEEVIRELRAKYKLAQDG